MSQDTETPAEPHYQVPGAVHEATRSLLRLRTGGDARRIAEHLVRELGGQLVPAGTDNPSVIPVDVSFGDGEPLLAAFGRRSVAVLEPFTRQLCRTLLDQTTGKVAFDAAAEYAQHIPVRVIVRFLGFPESDAGIFRRFIHQVMEEVDTTVEEREAMGAELNDYIDAQIDDHIASPRDDLTSFLLRAEIDGAGLSREHVRGTMILLMIAGIDTTWSAIGSSLWHLARPTGTASPPSQR